MAFPTTGTLDDFNTGAVQALSARAGWSATDHIIMFAGDLTTDAAPTYAAGGANNGNAWGTTFGDCEVWATFSALPNPNFCDLYARWDTASNSGYRLDFFQTSFPTMAVGVERITAGAGTGLGSTTVALAVGDSVGMSCIGSTISSWYKSGASAWTLVASATDTTYTSGLIGIYGNDSAYHVDTFGGGAAFPPLAGVNFQRKGDRRA